MLNFDSICGADFCGSCMRQDENEQHEHRYTVRAHYEYVIQGVMKNIHCRLILTVITLFQGNDATLH